MKFFCWKSGKLKNFGIFGKKFGKFWNFWKFFKFLEYYGILRLIKNR